MPSGLTPSRKPSRKRCTPKRPNTLNTVALLLNIMNTVELNLMNTTKTVALNLLNMKKERFTTFARTSALRPTAMSSRMLLKKNVKHALNVTCTCT